MEEALALPGGDEIASNQVLYNLEHRGIEWDLLPWTREHGISTTAYSPVGHKAVQQKRLFGKAELESVAARHGVTPAQVALAWSLREPDVVAIPKAVKREHIRENRAAHDLKLTLQDFAELDQAFPPPARKIPLETL
jgi:diketogulonate reductase-like aldo/keto reductase